MISRLYCVDSSGAVSGLEFRIVVGDSLLSFLVERRQDTFTNLCPAFRHMGEDRELFLYLPALCCHHLK